MHGQEENLFLRTKTVALARLAIGLVESGLLRDAGTAVRSNESLDPHPATTGYQHDHKPPDDPARSLPWPSTPNSNPGRR